MSEIIEYKPTTVILLSSYSTAVRECDCCINRDKAIAPGSPKPWPDISSVVNVALVPNILILAEAEMYLELTGRGLRHHAVSAC